MHFKLSPGERIYYRPDKGFFTFIPLYERGLISIPKMCGDGKFLRHLVWELVRKMEPHGFRGAFLCSRHRPEVYCRVIGGKLDHVEHTVNLNTGKEEPLYFYEVDLNDTREGEWDDKVYQSSIL
ncbi:hypothetical protein SDC9_187866 [bioreactor metagenome]|uniref:Uncharacterized protein n=1 Tax=bioreactor metagenome TaxID=1076179 RepID=A0A645HNC6_9ZZZZ